jgi:hypothetical protein
MLRSDCHPSTIVFALIAIAVPVLLARYYPPIHATIGLETWAPVLAIAALATATSALTWHWVQRGRWVRARVVQVPDFVLWGLTPIAVAYSCSMPWGVACALIVHGLMGLHWATICRRSWIMRAATMATWAPLFHLSSNHVWVAPLGIITLCLFIIVNQASNLRRAETEERDRERLRKAEAREQRWERDFQTLLGQFRRIRGERDRLAGRDER